MHYRFEELVNLTKVKKLLESHHGFSGMEYCLFDTNEECLLAVGWQDICMLFHRVHPVTCARCRESDAYIKQYLQGVAGEFLEYRCKNGMVHLAMPILVEGRHLATFFTGQFFYEDDLPDRELFVRQADEFGFEQDAYLAALDRVPLFSREHIRNNMLFLQNMVELLAETGLASLQSKQEAEERRIAEETLLKREAELQQQNEFQKSLLMALQNAEVDLVLAEGGRIIFCNDSRFGERFGLSEEDLAANPEFIRLVHPDDRARVADIYQRRSAGEQMPTNFEIGVQWANGERRELELVVSVIAYNPLKTLFVVKDITERKQMEEALAAREQEFRSLAKDLPVAVIRYDSGCRRRYVNPAAERMLHGNSSELLGNVPGGPTVPATSAMIAYYRGTMEEVLATGEARELDFVLDALPAAQQEHYEVRFAPEYDADGLTIGVLAIWYDVTELKRINETLLLQKFALDTINDAVFLIDENSMFHYVNKGACKELGYSQEELLGMGVKDIDPNFPIDGWRTHWKEIKKLGTTLMQSEHKRKDGTLFPIEVSSNYFEYNGVSYSLAVSRNITERKRMEDELQRKNSELERFTYTVSHDLKSPVITIKSFSGAIKQDLGSGRYDRVEKDLDRICTAADKMAALLDDLLKLSRSGKTIDAPEPVNMSALVGSALANLDGTIGESKVQVVVQPELPVVSCDRQRMLEVLQNLIENAVKYRGEQPEPRIEIGLRHDGGRQVFFVRDNGPGIEPKYHENIFGLFNRLETKIPGTGVGLALVKRIIEVHGGCVWVESDGQGNGSTFCFTVG